MTGPTGGSRGPAGLRRFLGVDPRRQPAAGERCEMCSESLREPHPHIADLERRGVRCACRACHLLFTGKGAAGGRYLSIPERYLHDPEFPLTEAQWDELQIPVRVVFFIHNSEQGRTVALYPSPAGATESMLPLDTAAGILGAGPAFADLAEDVEALLLRRRGDGFECFLLPVDACYRLVGLVRTHWKGFDGGEEAWNAIDGFFAELRERSRTVGAGTREVRR